MRGGGDEVNEFFRRGCQEKTSALTGFRDHFSRSSPLSFISLEKFGLLSVRVSFSADDDDAIESERAASEAPSSTEPTSTLTLGAPPIQHF